MAGLTISANEAANPEIEFARPRILSSARTLISGFLVGATKVSPTPNRPVKANKITIRQPGPYDFGESEKCPGHRKTRPTHRRSSPVPADEPQHEQLEGHDDCGVDGEGQRDHVVRDVGRHRRESWHPGIERPGADEAEQQRGQNHQTEPAVAKDKAVTDPGFIDYPCTPQARQRAQQDREKKTREAVGKEEHLEGPGMMGSDDDRGDRGADAKSHVLGRKVHL